MRRRRSSDEEDEEEEEEEEEQTYATASALWTGFQDRVTVLLKDGGLWNRSWGQKKTDSESSSWDAAVMKAQDLHHLRDLHPELQQETCRQAASP